MREVILTAEKREGAGKEAAHKLRADGVLPGILYGPETKPLSLSLKTKELTNLIRREGRTNMLIDLDLAGEKAKRKVVIKELQRDPLSGNFYHIDLYQVSMKRKLIVSIRVKLTGIPEGVKNSGGILQQVRRELEISCLPGDIPDSISIDVSHLGIGDSIHVSDISHEKVEMVAEPRLTIATVVPPTVIKVAEPAAELAEGEEAEAAEGEEGAEGEAAPAEEGKEEKPDEKKKEKKKE